ncbi:MAG: hypothetical protein R3B09_09275 [Nannocystaceae bacterium]
MPIHLHRLVIAAFVATNTACVVYTSDFKESATDAATTGDSATSETNPSSASGDPTGDEGPRPFEGEWHQVLDAPFPLDGISVITLGHAATSSNFANRGDVEVHFDLEDETITVELRYFTFQIDQAAADAEFAKLSLWAYVSAGEPKAPAEMDPTDACAGGWKDGCLATIYYDGAEQPPSTGADLRVHLPAAYRRLLHVVTEDELHDPGYPRRSDLRITDLCGSADLRFEGGRADVRLCRDLAPTPECPPEQIQACEDWTTEDGMGGEIPAPWDSECPCPTFGHLKIVSTEAASCTVDLPAGVWSNAYLRNDDPSQSAEGEHCDATVDLEACGDACEVSQSATTPWALVAEANFPGPSATLGAGYNVTVFSQACESVAYADSPADYVPGQPPKQEPRGDLRLCWGCLE